MPGRIRIITLCLAIAPAICAQTSVTPFISAPNVPNSTTVRFGQPIAFSGRVLPSDATGTLTFVIDGIQTQTVALTTQPLTDSVALGDDTTYAGYIADPAQRYPALLAQSLSATATNIATVGATACDLMPLEILPNNVATTPATLPLYSVLVGTNDIANFGTGAHEAVFRLCHQAALAWLGVPRAKKLLIGDTNVTIESGSWSPIAAPASCCLAALSNSTGNGTVRFTLTTAGAAYLWYVLDPNTSGSFSVSVDGSYASTPIQTQQLAPAITYGLLRLAASPGTHTFDINAQSGTITLLGMGSPPTSAAPTVLASDIPNQIGGNATAIAAYTADIQSNIAALQSDGLDVRFVPTQQFMFGSVAEMMDPTHPNAVGLGELAQAFESVAKPPSPLAVADAGYSTGTLPIGTHTVAITYSGDAKYPSSYAPTASIAIYDGTSTVTLTSDAQVYAAQSSITFTATVPQPNATGQILFSDESGPLGSAWLDEPNAGQAQLILPSLPIGVHTVTAQYLGDITYNASASAAISITVSGTYTATSLTAPGTRFFATTSVPVTATVTPATATGTITFADGGATQAQAQLVAGTATFTTPTLAPGIHTLTASYNGSTTLDQSTSPALSIEIDLNATDLTLLATPATATYGTPVSISAGIQPVAATGTVTLLDGTQSLGQAPLANGVATFEFGSLAPGTHPLTALYSGDANDLQSSATISVQVTLRSTTTALGPASATVPFDSPITFAAQVSPQSANGSVTFFDGNAILAATPITGGVANYVSATLVPGTHSMTATYSGDSVDMPSSSPASSITITPRSSTVTLTSLPATIYAGNPITLAATIAPSTSTGTVLFRDATVGVVGQGAVASGVASLTLPSPAVGTYSITAVYGGDSDDNAATSPVATTQVILNSTTATFVASPNSATFTSPITFTANVVPTTATGSFTFFEGSTPIGIAFVTNGSANLTTSTLTPGAHALHATYSGDAINAASASASVTETISLAASNSTITLAQNPIVASGQVILNIAVGSPASVPTGTVTVSSGSTILATGKLGNGSNGFAYATLSFNAATLGLGTFPLTASYSGDVDNQPSGSSANITVVAISTATIITLSATQIPISSPVTLTAAVAPGAIGTITFVSNGAIIGTAPTSSATYTFTPTSVGTFSLTAAFTPTGMYAASTSSAQLLTVTPPLSASFAATSVNAGPGTSATAGLTLTPLSGFSGPILATCSAPVKFITCTAAAPAALSTKISIPVQIKIATTTARVQFPPARGLVTLALALLLPIATCRRPRRLLFPSALVLATLWVVGCAEGGDFNSLPPGPETVTVTITAANTPVTATMTLVVVD